MPPHPLLTDVNRPEFYSAIEALISDMAWRALQSAVKENPSRARDLLGGLVGRIECGQSLVFEVVEGVSETFLAGHGYAIRTGDQHTLSAATAQQLSAQFGLTLDAPHGKRALDALRGVRPERSKVQPASAALWPGVFLQGLKGVLRKENPPNYLRIVATLYDWGAGEPTPDDLSGPRVMLQSLVNPPAGDPTNPVAGQMARAISDWAKTAGEQYAPLRELDRLRDLLSEWAEWGASSGRPEAASCPLAFRELDHTPYIWFFNAANRLCSDEWRVALPAARWTDWLGAVLRNAIGLGFLFEARYYLRLGQALLTPDPGAREVWTGLRKSLEQPLLRWSASDATASERNVLKPIAAWCSGGEAVRLWLTRNLGTADFPIGLSLAEKRTWLDHLAQTLDGNAVRSAWQASLQSAIETTPGGTRTEEVVKAALVCRERFTTSPDLYSLLMSRARGRSLVVEPAEEWLTVVSSLCNPSGPGRPTTLASLRHSLARLGIDAPRQAVVQELERSGLAESAHDSDDALVVSPAF
jgi:hypothetical protein